MVPQWRKRPWQSSSILHHPEMGRLQTFPIVSMGVGVLFGGHVGGSGPHAAVQNRQPDFCPYLVLDLPCTQTQRALWARSCSMSPALKAT